MAPLLSARPLGWLFYGHHAPLKGDVRRQAPDNFSGVENIEIVNCPEYMPFDLSV
jgi:hypothetical protein